MDRTDKIFTALSLAGLAGFLLWQRGCMTPSPRMNASALPNFVVDKGPAYLVSALPNHRRADDAAPPVSN